MTGLPRCYLEGPRNVFDLVYGGATFWHMFLYELH